MSKGFFGNLFDTNHDGKLSSTERAMDFCCTYANAGLDPNDLKFMDEDERREAIEDAGLDPDDYDDL